MPLPLGMEVGLSPGEFVLDGDPASPPQKGSKLPPQFPAHFYCGKTARCIKMPFGTEVGLSTGDFLLDGDPAALSKKGAELPPQFSAHVYCGQTAGWIKMALGTEVGLGPSHPAPLPKKGAELSPIFGPFLLWPNGWMHQDATWYGGRPQLRRLYGQKSTVIIRK